MTDDKTSAACCGTTPSDAPGCGCGPGCTCPACCCATATKAPAERRGSAALPVLAGIALVAIPVAVHSLCPSGCCPWC